MKAPKQSAKKVIVKDLPAGKKGKAIKGGLRKAGGQSGVSGTAYLRFG